MDRLVDRTWMSDEDKRQAQQSEMTFLPESSELSGLILDLDWSQTPLGPLQDWPQSLKTVTGLLLRSPVPIVLLWGEPGIMIYNDAYAVIAGARHPGLLGSEVREGWPEVAEFNDHVMKVGLAGGTLAYRDQELTLYRSGRAERVWMNLDYSPVLDESGQPAGVIAVVVETSDRVRVEQRLKLQEARLTRMFEQAPGVMAMLSGPDHVYEMANPAYRRLVGERDLIGRPVREALPELEQQGFFDLLDTVYRSGEAFVGSARPVRLQRAAGQPPEERLLDFVYQPLTDQEGQVAGIFVEGFDVTERIEAQARVRNSEERFRALVNATADVVYQMDAQWTYLRHLDGKGLLEDPTPLSDWLSNCVHPDDRPRVLRAVRDACAHPQVFELEHRLHRPDGAFSWMLLRAVPLFAADGTLLEWFGASTDITTRKQAEDALRENERRLRFLDLLAKDTAGSTDADTILERTTRLLGEHLDVSVCAYADMDADQDGFSVRGDWTAPGASSLVGHYSLASFGRMAVENLRAGVPLIINDVRHQLEGAEAEVFLSLGLEATVCLPLVKDGRLTALMAVHDRQPRIWGPYELSLLTEVTERSWSHIERLRFQTAAREREQRFVLELEAKVAERTAALAQSEARLRAIFETSHLYQGLLDVEGRVLYSNATALAGIDADNARVQGLPYWETPWFSATPGMPEAVRAAVQRVAAGGSENVSMTLNLPTGVRSFDFSLRPVLDDAGEVVGMVPEAVEKTARLKAEQNLQQVQKMEALGRLTGGIAHDFNNLLMIVLGSLELLRKRMPADPALLRFLDNAKAGAERGATLTGRMLSFARKQELRSARIDLCELVVDMRDLLVRSLGPSVVLETSFPEQLSLVETDPNQLESALLNLAVNARDAMAGHGRIIIAAREQRLDDGEHGLLPGRYVCLSVTDTGEGMDEVVLKRASEPFFTTKGVGKGTGLGLSMVHGLALQSGGTLVLESRPGVGTTANIWLPALDDGSVTAAEPVWQASPDPAWQGPLLTILAVDDDELVLLNTADMLSEHGHRVLSARSAQDALVMLGQLKVDLVITDHAMPQMTGVQLAEQLRVSHPQLPVILVSGYAELPPEIGQDLPRLAKPFSQQALLQIIGQTAAGHGAAG